MRCVMSPRLDMRPIMQSEARRKTLMGCRGVAVSWLLGLLGGSNVDLGGARFISVAIGGFVYVTRELQTSNGYRYM